MHGCSHMSLAQTLCKSQSWKASTLASWRVPRDFSYTWVWVPCQDDLVTHGASVWSCAWRILCWVMCVGSFCAGSWMKRSVLGHVSGFFLAGLWVEDSVLGWCVEGSVLGWCVEDGGGPGTCDADKHQNLFSLSMAASPLPLSLFMLLLSDVELTAGFFLTLVVSLFTWALFSLLFFVSLSESLILLFAFVSCDLEVLARISLFIPIPWRGPLCFSLVVSV